MFIKKCIVVSSILSQPQLSASAAWADFLYARMKVLFFLLLRPPLKLK